MTRLLLADDHPMIRTALEVLLRDTAFEIVGTVASGDAAFAEIERLTPDILLLDLHMPGGNGMEVLRRVRASGIALKVIILTAGIDDSSLLEARALKVQGLVLKNSDPAYLLDCLERVRRGSSWTDPDLSDRAAQLAATLGRDGRPSLAPRERQLVTFVRGGLRNREIAERLGVTEGTVKAYLHSVFEKLGVGSRTELAIRADEFLAEEQLRN